MYKAIVVAIAAISSADFVAAESNASLLVASPGGAKDFCYYASLAYSEDALLTVDVTNRRESPQATQKTLMKCVRDEESETLIWRRMNDE